MGHGVGLKVGVGPEPVDLLPGQGGALTSAGCRLRVGDEAETLTVGERLERFRVGDDVEPERVRRSDHAAAEEDRRRRRQLADGVGQFGVRAMAVIEREHEGSRWQLCDRRALERVDEGFERDEIVRLLQGPHVAPEGLRSRAV
jgi:hypothetical protein